MKKTLLYSSLTALLLGLLSWTAHTQTQLNSLTRATMSSATVTVNAKTPMTIGTNYRMTAPASAPTVTTSATVGIGCSNIHTYHWYTAWVNEAGVTALSPASLDWIPSPTLKKATITRVGNPPANAKGWLVYMSNEQDGDAGKFLTASGGAAATLEAGFIASGTTSVTFNCAITGMTYASAPSAGLRALTSINVLGDQLVGRASFAGGNINLITENANVSNLAMLNNETLALTATTNAAPTNGVRLDADNGTLDVYKGGAVAGRTRETSWMPPECPADVQDMEVGVCYDQATGKLKVRDAAGVRDL